VTIREAIAGWAIEDRNNLWALLGGAGSPPDDAGIEDRFKWLYHSRSVANAETKARELVGRVRSKLSDHHEAPVSTEALRELPRFDRLIVEASKHLKAYEGDPTLEECELYLSQAVVAAALHRMSPTQRIAFFREAIPFHDLAERAGVRQTDVRGPVTTIAALGLAQASGFGIYAASTTALGFLTHAVGVTLPFAAYTGLTTTIGFIIGPAGWLAAGLWGVWKLTQPKWKKLVPPLVYIISCNSRRRTADEGSTSS